MKAKSPNLDAIAHQVRKNIIDMLVPKESHHIGCALDIVEILTALYYSVLRIDPQQPEADDRDIFILSKGHGGAALYAVLAEKGFFDKALLHQYDTDGGILPEHATKVVPGVEYSAGSLGHGLPVGVGFAMSFKRDNKDNKVYVLTSDGELDEGSNWESILFAGHHNLANVTVIIDYNKMQGFGAVKDVLTIEPIADKFRAFGWNTYSVDGHDCVEIKNTIESIHTKANTKPTCIIAHTIKGKGIDYFEGKFESHYKSISQETKEALLSKF